VDRTEGEEGGSKVGLGGLVVSFVRELYQMTYIPRQISDNETTSVRCGGSKFLESLLEYTRDHGSLVSVSVKLGDRLLSLIVRRENEVG